MIGPLASVEHGKAKEGRDTLGRFGTGNRISRGNTHQKRVANLRMAVFEACKPADMREIIAKLVCMAKDGDAHAAKIVLDRALGKVPEIIIPIDGTEPLVKIILGIDEDRL